jgi:tetratricopeptide (TPR) repeat protein
MRAGLRRKPLPQQMLAIVSLLVLPLLHSPAFPKSQQSSDEARAQARVFLKQGVQDFKTGQFDQAIENFKRAKELDPSLVNASLYLATAYANQYIPGAPSKENTQLGQQAIEEFRAVLSRDPTNLSAIDGIGSILYTMAGVPFDSEMMNDSKAYHQKHIDIRPKDVEPYYWIGLIDWSLVYRANRELRQNWMQKKSVTLATNDALPEVVREEFQNQFESIVDDGIEHIKQAIVLQPDYDDAMAYLNLLYRMKAEMEPTVGLRDADLREADELVDRVKEIKKKKLESSEFRLR